ncbi:helix-turn-helix domain-containing protein [Nonomuraea typhae]|uniref:helix-turn-helix domain-containing protein n=1 Tax=Nonomuraea typhae TaxID=2603600 RepID=UPI0015E257A8|nr:helix-turn-helix transcriptional regulator [Nonomuraea typhae]
MDEITIGLRLRTLRRWRGMKQAELAGLAGISQSYLSMAERGQRAIDNRWIIADLASALQISESDLTGGPHLTQDPLQARPHATVAALRFALTSAELGESAVDRARPIGDLRALMRRDGRTFGPIERAWRANDYITMGQLLPDVIDELHWHIADPADEATHRAALNTMVDAAMGAAGLARILGYPDLGHIGAAKAAEAAARLGDPLARGKAMYAFARSDGGDWSRAARRAQQEFSRFQAAAGSSEDYQVLGMLALNASMAAAASRDSDTARALLDEAAEIAELVPDDIDRNWQSFSATNVAVWRIKIGVELGESGGKMLELAEDVDESKLESYPARKANFLTEVGRGLARERRTRRHAEQWLLKAEKAGPQRFRNNSRVKEVVAVALEQDRVAASSRELRGIASRLGIPH